MASQPKQTPLLPLTVADIGTRVRQARRAQGLKQKEAAGLLGVGERFLSELERGKETLEIGKVLKVLQGLKIPLTLE